MVLLVFFGVFGVFQYVDTYFDANKEELSKFVQKILTKADIIITI